MPFTGVLNIYRVYSTRIVQELGTSAFFKSVLACSRVLPCTTIDFSRVQPLNTSSPIEVTLFGIIMDFNPLHELNAPNPILLTFFGIITDVNLIHHQNAKRSIKITLLGIVISVNPEQFQNA